MVSLSYFKNLSTFNSLSVVENVRPVTVTPTCPCHILFVVGCSGQKLCNCRSTHGMVLFLQSTILFLWFEKRLKNKKSYSSFRPLKYVEMCDSPAYPMLNCRFWIGFCQSWAQAGTKIRWPRQQYIFFLFEITPTEITYI